MDAFGGIYEIRNTLNGKRYIGKSVNIRVRWQDHKAKLRSGNNPCGRLQDAWNKYGEASFVFAVLEVVPNPDHLIAREQYYFDLLDPEYIIARKAGSLLGYRHSPEARRRIALANARRIITPETRRKMSEIRKGNWGEVVQVAVRARLSKPVSDEARAKMSAARKGRTLSEEHRRHISEGQRGNKRGPETSRKISENNRRWTRTPEHLEKLWAGHRAAAERRRQARQQQERQPSLF